jgi:hypothetical protein
MSAITSRVLNERLQACAVVHVLGGGTESTREYFDAIQKAPRLVLVWHFLGLAGAELVRRSPR